MPQVPLGVRTVSQVKVDSIGKNTEHFTVFKKNIMTGTFNEPECY